MITMIEKYLQYVIFQDVLNFLMPSKSLSSKKSKKNQEFTIMITIMSMMERSVVFNGGVTGLGSGDNGGSSHGTGHMDWSSHGS